jgi:hypothetical protein
MTSDVTARNSYFSQYFLSVLCGARKGYCGFLGNSAVLSLMVLALTMTASGQSLVVTSSGSAVSQGSTRTINTIPNMPNLVLSVTGGSSCDTVSYNVALNYTDEAGATTEASYGAQDVAGNQPVTINWLGILEGGSVTITWQFNGVSEPTFGFFINGSNPQPNAIDAYASSGPWFIRNLITAESSYLQFDGTGNPVYGSPDGIGLLQLEPPNRLSSDQDYWSWPANVADGLTTLNKLQAAASSFWNSQVSQWQADPAGPANPVPENAYTYCDFKYPPTGGDSYADGEWIKAYNGAAVYYIFWSNSTNGSNPPNGHWVINDSAGYVKHVCSSAPK